MKELKAMIWRFLLYLMHEKRSGIQGAIMEMDIDLGRPDIFLSSEHEYREYRTALYEIIEKFI